MTTMRNERGGRGFPGRAAISRRLAAAVLTLFAATVVLLGMAAVASGQETGGAINGRVLDHQGAVLPGVAVMLKNASTNAELNTVTNEQGAFVHPFVPIGRYILTATSRASLRSSVRRSTCASVTGCRWISRCRSAR